MQHLVARNAIDKKWLIYVENYTQIEGTENSPAYLCHDEASAVQIKRPRAPGGIIVVVEVHRHQILEACERQGGERGFGTAAYHDIGIPVAQQTQPVAKRMRSRGTSSLHAVVRTLRPSLHCDDASCSVTQYHGNGVRTNS